MWVGGSVVWLLGLFKLVCMIGALYACDLQIHTTNCSLLSLLPSFPPSLPTVSQAQCIENLRPETFIKCLRNLWIGVTIINPLLSILAISILPIPEINANSDTVLSRMAMVSGEWAFGEGSYLAQLFSDWMSIEAFCVLSGGK